MSKLKNLESTVTLAQKSIMIAFRDLGGSSGIIYTGIGALSTASFLKEIIESLRLALLFEYKEEFKETEWKLVNENGTYHSTGDNALEFKKLEPVHDPETVSTT